MVVNPVTFVVMMRFYPGASLVEHAVVDRHDHAVIAVATSKAFVASEILAELAELPVGDVLWSLQDGPLDTLCARWSREGALIGPVGFGIK